MEVLKFTLSGKSAFFKKPELNSICYFTYGCIHKVALMGIFGSILGYGGYAQMKDMSSKGKKKSNINYPEFYNMLSDIKIAIVPKNENGAIPKKIQLYNNSVGYASKEMGGNLIVKEQWLENPEWDIYFTIDSTISTRLAQEIENHNCVFIPYLGKNDHFADITQIERIQASEAKGNVRRINSLLIKSMVSFDIDDEMEEEDEEELDPTFKYEESLPVGLDIETQMYQYQQFIYSNMPIKEYGERVYKVSNLNLTFF